MRTFVHETDQVTMKFFPTLRTLRWNASPVHQQIPKQNKHTEAKANKSFGLQVQSSHVCATVADRPLWVVQASRTLGWRLGFVCLSKFVQACNWNKLHTPHSKKGRALANVSKDRYRYTRSKRNAIFSWVSLFVLIPLIDIQRFTLSMNSKIFKRRQDQTSDECNDVTSSTKHFECPQLWN